MTEYDRFSEPKQRWPEPDKAEVVAATDDYVAWLCFDRHENGATTIHVCSSDTKGAFKVYRESRVKALEAAIHNLKSPAHAICNENLTETLAAALEATQKLTAAESRCLALTQSLEAFVSSLEPQDDLRGSNLSVSFDELKECVKSARELLAGKG